MTLMTPQWLKSDRNRIKRLPLRLRLRVEELVMRGDLTQVKIELRLKLKDKLTVGACKRWPWPGGPIDGDGEMAKKKGEWIDDEGIVRPWVGLGEDGQPIKKGEVKKPGAMTKARVIAFQQKTLEKKIEEEPKVDPALQASADFAEADMPSREDVDGHAEPGDAAVPAREMTDMDRALAELPDKAPRRSSKGQGRIREARALIDKYLSLEARIKSLCELAKAVEFPQVALRAHQMLNMLDGLEAQAKAVAPQMPGSAPLFNLPKGDRGELPVQVFPVGSQAHDLGTDPGVEPEPFSDELVETASSLTAEVIAAAVKVEPPDSAE